MCSVHTTSDHERRMLYTFVNDKEPDDSGSPRCAPARL
jgi:hypothetical protein